MKIREMHHRFEQEIDRISTQDRPDFLPNERDDYLNKAVWVFLKDRYDILNNKRQGFETNQRRIDNLRNLHVKSPQTQDFIVPIDLGSGSYEVQLKDLKYRYLFLTDVYTEIEKDGCTKFAGMKQWQTDDIKTVYSDPSFQWRRVLGNLALSNIDNPENKDRGSLYLYTRDKYGDIQFAINKVFISYIKYPIEVFFGGYDHINGDSEYTAVSGNTFDCDIDEGFHDEIVTIAVQLAMKDIQDRIGFQLETTKVQTDK